MEELEIWKDIEGYKGLYQVSNYGQVKSLKFGKEKILKQCKLKDGYLYVRLCQNGKGKTYKVHRLVVKCFLEAIEGKDIVNHKNEIKTDNRVENLEWVSSKENANYGTRNERISERHKKPILQFTKDMVFVREFDSATIASTELNINLGHINSVCNFKRKTCGGYIWRYK